MKVSLKFILGELLILAVLSAVILASTLMQDVSIFVVSSICAICTLLHISYRGRWDSGLTRSLILLCPIVFSGGLPVFAYLGSNEYIGVFVVLALLYYSLGVACLYAHLIVSESQRKLFS